MARLVIHGLDFDSITQLKKRHAVVWIGDDPRADVIYSDVRDRCIAPFPEPDQVGLQRVLMHVASKAHQIFESYSRHHYLRRFNGRSVQDYSYLMAAHVEWAYHLLRQQQSDLVLFSNFPHEGYDNVLHEVANCLGIRTVNFFQVPFAPRHWALYGGTPLAETMASALTDAGVELDDEQVRTFIQKLDGQGTYFYMKSIRPVAIPNLREICQALLKGRLKQAAAGSFAAVQQAVYQFRLSRLVAASPPLKQAQAYGYFPLHLQPEMTTSALGDGLYFNQVIALRHFAAFCEQSDMPVVVKDNPKQNYSHRSDYFFDAVASIANVICVSRETSSQQLIEGASVVGTITGTAGLEALRHGKPVVCYGDAWWRGIAGVHGPSATVGEVFGCAVDRDKVAQGIRRIYGLSAAGCSDPDCVAAFTYASVKNSMSMVASVEAVLATLVSGGVPADARPV